MNYTMNYMKAIGILLVVAGHVSGEVLHWFPAFSFHMPLFIFVSGYLYKTSYEENVRLFFRKKFSSLLLPYYRWNLFYGIVATILLAAGCSNPLVSPLTVKSFLLDPWLHGSAQYWFNSASWFVLALFLIMAWSLLLRKALKCLVRSEWGMTLVFAVLCYAGESLSSALGLSAGHNGGLARMMELSLTESLGLNAIKTLFGAFFFQVGILYREKLEQRDGFRSWLLMLVILLQPYLIYRQQGNINFIMAFGEFPEHNLWIPMVTSLTGIYLCLKLCEMLSACTGGQDKFLNFLGRSSWTIMVNHFFGIWLCSAVLYVLNKHQLLELSGFDAARFRSAWDYIYLGWGEFSLALYFAFALGFSCLVQWLRDKNGVKR